MRAAKDRPIATRGCQTAAFLLLLVLPVTAQTIAPPTRAQRIVLVSVPDRQLAVLEDGNVLAQFPIAVGAAESPSPAGEFAIVQRLTNPTYYHSGVVIPPGKNNPTGTRWVGLSEKGYGIHGTNAPKSIGHAASHGCIRLRNRDMEQLFTMLRVGDVVRIRGERDEETAEIFGGAADDTTIASTEEEPSSGVGQ
jgi:L,D-transpeptidase ErfK/SrfK